MTPAGRELTAFKAYDVRGEFGTELTPAIAQATAHALVMHIRETYGALQPTIVVGHDMRSHSPLLHESVCHGIQQAGATALDIGLVSTPMTYFAVNHFAANGGIMITASHNPAKDNGLKICRDQAIPIAGGSPESELESIKRRVLSNMLPTADQLGKHVTTDIKPSYHNAIKQEAQNCRLRKFRIVADFANGMGSVEAQVLEELFTIISLYPELDGSFPNHPANPLNHRNLEDVAKATREHNADFGLAFDGDADRVGFVDENGTVIPMDLITGLIAQWYLKGDASGNVLHDLRTSQATIETIREHGGTPIACRVGHSFLKQAMREHNGIFGGELAGHFYFREMNYVESTALAVIRVAAIMSEANAPLSAVARSLRRYANSGELNLDLPNRDDARTAINRLKAQFPDAEMCELDGLRLQMPDWWCNVRPSNTEPRLRVVIEANTDTELKALQSVILATLQG